jgi:HEAT repeat protein
LRTSDLSRRIETIRALSFLPGEESKNILASALESNLEEIVVAATDAVATSEGSRAVPALLDVLAASLRTNRTDASRTLVEVLGRLGDERAVPRLSAILERKPILRRGHHHAIQIAAIDALAILPTKEARRSIERAARHGTRPVRDRARMRLDENRDTR